MKILVTGGAGFIGSHFVRKLLTEDSVQKITILDNLSYAGRRENMLDFIDEARVTFVEGDINNFELFSELLADLTHIVNFAAESHVDRSIQDSSVFIKTNVLGTNTLLTAAKNRANIRFLQVSTDEVYGSIDLGEWDETCPLLPNSPYSASKASADLLVRSFHITHGLDTVITRCSNNYGPFQYPEKLIPLSIIRLLNSQKIEIYGDGMNIRDWLHVSDHCHGIFLALVNGESGATYNFGGNSEKSNLDIARVILDNMNQGMEKIKFVEDRKGHDFRYAVDSSKSRIELGFLPKIDFEHGMESTIDWYKRNSWWWQEIVAR
jgi:dTDP-glucose 4,6-dehydratase